MPAPPVNSKTVVYLITGANRGLGYAVTERLAARSSTLVYAGARDPAKADKLQQLATKYANVRVVQLRVDSDADHQAAAKQVEAEAGRVDVLLANAGISESDAYEMTNAQTIDKLRQHFEVNTVGPVRLFNVFFTLLTRSTNPKFIVVSSLVGSIANQEQLAGFRTANYGSSKAAINFITQRIHVEHPTITTFPLHPGWVQTDMGHAGAKVHGIDGPPVTVEQSVNGIVKAIDESDRANYSGKLWDVIENKVIAW